MFEKEIKPKQIKNTYKTMKIEKHYNIIVLLFLCIGITSCKDPVDIDYIGYEKKTVVDAINTVDSTFAVRLTDSRWAFSNVPFKEIANADVNLWVNGNKCSAPTFTTWKRGKNYYVFDSYSLREGDSLRLTATVNNKEISAGCRVPEKPQISNFNATQSFVISEYENYTADSGWFTVNDTSYIIYNISFSLNDNPSKKNFYQIEVLQKTKNGDIQTADIYIDDYLLLDNISSFDIVEDYGLYTRKFLFSDNAINGRDYTVKVEVDLYNYDNELAKYYDNVVFRISEISSDLYYFLKTRDASQNSDELFSEPTLIHTNVENGIGIMGALNPLDILLWTNPDNEQNK